MPDEKPPAPATPPAMDEAGIKSKLLEERLARAEADNRQLYANLQAAANRPAPAPTPIEDPLDKLATDLSLPDSTKKDLDRAMQLRAQRYAEGSSKQLADRTAEFMFQREQEIAYTMMLQLNPDMAKDEEGIAMSAAAVELEASKKNQRLNPTAFYKAVADKYRQHHPKASPPPVYVEGSGAPNMQRPLGQPEPEPEGPNQYESDYDMPQGLVQDLRSVKIPTMTEKYVNERNDLLNRVEGVVSWLGQVAKPLADYRRAQKAVAK